MIRATASSGSPFTRSPFRRYEGRLSFPGRMFDPSIPTLEQSTPSSAAPKTRIGFPWEAMTPINDV